MRFWAIRLAILVLAAVGFVAGCSNPSPPAGPTPIEEVPLLPSDITKIPSEWKSLVDPDTGETLPIKVRILFLSPEPGSIIIGGVIPDGGCNYGSPYCWWSKLEVCVSGDLMFYGERPRPLNSPSLSNEEGERGYNVGLGVLVGPDADGCYTYNWTKEVSGNGFQALQSIPPGTCCQYLNIFVNSGVYKKGEVYDPNRSSRAFAAFPVYFRATR